MLPLKKVKNNKTSLFILIDKGLKGQPTLFYFYTLLTSYFPRSKPKTDLTYIFTLTQ